MFALYIRVKCSSHTVVSLHFWNVAFVPFLSEKRHTLPCGLNRHKTRATPVKWSSKITQMLHTFCEYSGPWNQNALYIDKENNPKIKWVKVKLSLYFFFNWAPRHEGVPEEWMYNSTYSLTSVLDGGEWSASHPDRFYPQEKSPWYLSDRRLGGPQSRSGRGDEEKIPSPLRESNPRTPIV
jgi:hypothetical protein